MKRLIVLVLTLAALAGCETVGGMGRDISRGAEAVDRML